MKLIDAKLGQEVILGKYKGIIVEIDDESITVQFNDWSTINPWTNSLPRITFKNLGLLDKVRDE